MRCSQSGVPGRTPSPIDSTSPGSQVLSVCLPYDPWEKVLTAETHRLDKRDRLWLL
jgi:hypothetical protein